MMQMSLSGGEMDPSSARRTPGSRGSSARRVNGLRKLDTFGLRKLDTFSDRLAVPGGEFDGGMVCREGVPGQVSAR